MRFSPAAGRVPRLLCTPGPTGPSLRRFQAAAGTATPRPLKKGRAVPIIQSPHNPARVAFAQPCGLLMSFEPLPSSSVPSPCIKVCTLDPRGICIGCGRTLSEIAEWSRLSAEQQREVCRRAQERRQAGLG